MRLKEVLSRFPISRSSWYRGVTSGKYPRGVRLGDRAVGWRERDVNRLIASLHDEDRDEPAGPDAPKYTPGG